MASGPGGDDTNGDKDKTPKESYYRKPLPYLFEKELINNQNRHVYVVDKFVVTRKIPPIQDKFYSKYYDGSSSLPEKYFKLVETSQRQKRHNKVEYPLMESQVYGWIPKHMSRRDVSYLNYINAPKLRHDMTIYGEKFISERITERPSFNGLRFFLQ